MNKGFTLIELLVVVLIIGILAAAAMPQYFKQKERSKSAQLISLLKSVEDAQKRYRELYGTFSKTFSGLDISIIPLSSPAKPTCASISVGNANAVLRFKDFEVLRF